MELWDLWERIFRRCWLPSDHSGGLFTEVISAGMEAATYLVYGFYLQGEDLPAGDDTTVPLFTAMKKLIK